MGRMGTGALGIMCSQVVLAMAGWVWVGNSLPTLRTNVPRGTYSPNSRNVPRGTLVENHSHYVGIVT